MVNLYLGGARSGKSRLAEAAARESGLAVTYIATGQGLDEEMASRIAHHQQQRPSTWQLVEEPLALADILVQEAAVDRCLLVDCLTLWLSNHLCNQEGDGWPAAKMALLTQLSSLPGEIILVSNEVGQGIVPLGEINRRFVDEAGWLHQGVAEVADKVFWVVAGLPQQLK